MNKVTCEEEDWCHNRAEFKVGSKPVCNPHLPKAIRQVRELTAIVNGVDVGVAVSAV